MADIVVHGLVESTRFKVRVDADKWHAMSEDEKKSYMYDCAEEFDKISVTYWERLGPSVMDLPSSSVPTVSAKP